MFYQPIEPFLFSDLLSYELPLETMEDGRIIVKEIQKLRLKLRKARYIADCVSNGDMKLTEENQQYIDSIPSFESQLSELSDLSQIPTVRLQLQKVLRKCLLNFNWEQLHFLYVCFCTRIPFRELMALSLLLLIS